MPPSCNTGAKESKEGNFVEYYINIKLHLWLYFKKRSPINEKYIFSLLMVKSGKTVM